MVVCTAIMASQTIVEDPELQDTAKADDSGRIYLGSEYAGKEVKFIIEEVISEE